MNTGKNSEKAASSGNRTDPAKAKDTDASVDRSAFFNLERSFADAGSAFLSSKVASPAQSDTIVMLDTNVLLLPYTVAAHSLADLRNVYERLADDGRLLLPARAAREFSKHRDRKLAEVFQGLNDAKSRIRVDGASLPPLLEGLEGTEELRAANQDLVAAKKRYGAALEKIVGTVGSWRGDDPVTLIYHRIFGPERIVEPPSNEDEIGEEWARRQQSKAPPGYKDTPKDDGGVGDFRIWLSILHIGETRRKDVTFVTGDQKADWFVRDNGLGVYPRPELIAEFRSRSGGRNLRLVSLHELLKEMSAPAELVEEVATAERSRQAFLLDSNANRLFGITESSIAHFQRWEFNLPYGGGAPIPISMNGYEFLVQFSERDEKSVWIYQSTETKNMSVFPPLTPGMEISHEFLGDTERAQPISLEQIAFIRNLDGASLALRLKSLKIFTDKGGFQLKFDATVSNPNERIRVP